MGLFNKIFDKKTCDICGGEIGMLGNRKLSDGNCCKSCAQKLSPWLTDRRECSVAEIRQHLQYRVDNERMLAGIHPTKVLGSDTKVYIDENAGKFFVTRHSNWRDRNPDLISFSQVIEVRNDVQEHREEEYHRDREGKRVPFNPPRYRFTYEFITTLMIDSPYFNEIRFELTSSGQRPERIGDESYRYYEQLGEELRYSIMAPQPSFAAQAVSAVQNAFANLQAAAAQAQQAQSVAAQPTVGEQWTCSSCGAVNTSKFCVNCGAKRPEAPRVFRCDKCGWTPADPTNPPKFCPNCGDPFTGDDAV